MELRGLTIPYAKYKAKKGRGKETNIQKRLGNWTNLSLALLVNWKLNIKLWRKIFVLSMKIKLRAQLSAPKQDWSSKVKSQPNIFFNLEYRNYNRKVINSLKKPEGELITDELKSLLKILKYQNSKIQLEMNWKEKSLLKNVKAFFAL